MTTVLNTSPVPLVPPMASVVPVRHRSGGGARPVSRSGALPLRQGSLRIPVAIGVGLGLVVGSLLASQNLPLPVEVLPGRTEQSSSDAEVAP
jgi:hypothetical protein